MKCYLCVDFGSTYTKLTLIDIEKEELVGTAKSYTTIETNVYEGYKNALDKLNETVDKPYTVVKKLACSSAAGGLKIVAIGLVKELTAEAAKRAALGAGARVISTYSYNLNKMEVEEILKSGADIILLAGGTNGGNTESIVHNARMLSESEISIPIVVGGNKSAYDEIVDAFEEKGKEYYLTENVMPELNSINVEPARETIRKIFMENIVKAKGMDHVEENISEVLMPTPQAVLKAAEALSLGSKDEEGIGELLVVDIGGATTDIHSIAKGYPTKAGVVLQGLEEPLSKRTVEGDLGMRYSLLSVYEAVGKLGMAKYIDLDKFDIDEELRKRHDDKSFVSEEANDIEFDEGIAKICTDLSIKRHTGRVKAIYSPMGTMFAQTGKDLSELPYILGTGGILVNSQKPEEILSAGIFTMEDPESLKPRYPEYLLDKNYILSSMGLLTTVDENMAIRIMKKYIV